MVAAGRDRGSLPEAAGARQLTQTRANMRTQLQLAIAAVTQERHKGFDESFARVAALVPEYPPDGLADGVIDDIPVAVPWEVTADILGILIWSTGDNGSSIMRAAEQWLIDALDVRRIQLALNLDVYPFATNDQMQHVLTEVAKRFPKVDFRCKTLIDSRAQLSK